MTNWRQSEKAMLKLWALTISRLRHDMGLPSRQQQVLIFIQVQPDMGGMLKCCQVRFGFPHP